MSVLKLKSLCVRFIGAISTNGSAKPNTKTDHIKSVNDFVAGIETIVNIEKMIDLITRYEASRLATQFLREPDKEKIRKALLAQLLKFYDIAIGFVANSVGSREQYNQLGQYCRQLDNLILRLKQSTLGQEAVFSTDFPYAAPIYQPLQRMHFQLRTIFKQGSLYTDVRSLQWDMIDKIQKYRASPATRLVTASPGELGSSPVKGRARSNWRDWFEAAWIPKIKKMTVPEELNKLYLFFRDIAPDLICEKRYSRPFEESDEESTTWALIIFTLQQQLLKVVKADMLQLKAQHSAVLPRPLFFYHDESTACFNACASYFEKQLKCCDLLNHQIKLKRYQIEPSPLHQVIEILGLPLSALSFYQVPTAPSLWYDGI